MPTRRELLLGAGTLAGVVGVAGYGVLTDPGLVPGTLRDFEVRDGSATDYEPSLTPAPGVELGDDDLELLATVGSRSDVLVGDARRPHDLVLVNDADRRRRLSVAVSVDGDRVLSRTPAVDPGNALVVGLLEPARFGVAGGTPARTARTVVEPGSFDCNLSTTYFVVGADGVSVTGSATTMGCGWHSDL